MAQKLETIIPGLYDGIATDEAVTFGSTLAVTGAITATGGVVGSVTGTASAVAGTVAATTLSATGLVKVTNPVVQSTVTTIDAQNGTPTIAQLLGGVILHNSKTGAGTVTTPTGTEISDGISGVAVGSMFKTLYHNYGNQTATITAGASGVTISGGTAAVTTGKHSELTFLCTAANTWTLYLTTLF